MRTLASYEAYLFDVDGTLLKPGAAIPGAAETLALIKQRGKAVRAVTNNSGLSRHAVAERFRRYGLPLTDQEVFSALAATAQLIAHERPAARVHVYGSDGMRFELAQAGLVPTEDSNPEYVVAGHHPEISLERLTSAMRALLHGARFIAVNLDRRYLGRDGPIPGAGAFVAALERASGRSPDVVVGKPSVTIVHEAVASVGCAPEACLFVGDNLDADVGAAHAAGLDALLVLSGVTDERELGQSGLSVEHVLPSVAELADHLRDRAA